MSYSTDLRKHRYRRLQKSHQNQFKIFFYENENNDAKIIIKYLNIFAKRAALVSYLSSSLTKLYFFTEEDYMHMCL